MGWDRRSWIGAWVGLALLGACSLEKLEPHRERCTPGDIRVCTGAGECVGIQECDSTGTSYGPCECIADGAGGSSSSSGGTGGVAGGGSGAAGEGAGAAGAGSGAAGAGGGGEGGSGIKTGEDECPGDWYVLTAPTSLALSGDTSTANNGYESVCEYEQASGPELVYELDVQEAGSLQFTLTTEGSSSLMPLLYVRTAAVCGSSTHPCADDDCTIWCGGYNSPVTGGFHAEPGVYYVFVDGTSSTAGPYKLEVEFDAPSCGDGVVNPGTGNEECDDGNSQPDDGCDACQLTLATTGDHCPGEPVLLFYNAPLVIVGLSAFFQDDYVHQADNGCATAGMAGGKDRIYELVPEGSGTVMAQVGYDVLGDDLCLLYGPSDAGCWDRSLYAFDHASCGVTQIACSDQSNPHAPEEIAFAVTAGQSYYLVVDGEPSPIGSEGEFYLWLSLMP